MDPVTGATIISGVSNAGNVASQLLANRANKKMAEYQYTKDLEMWNRANEYNSPVQQMARLKQAGINPNMVYGGGSVVNTSNNLPKYQAPRLDAPSIRMDPMLQTNVIAKHQAIEQSKQQVDNMKLQNDLLALDREQRQATMQAVINQKIAESKTAAERFTWQKIANDNAALKFKFDTETFGIRKAQATANYQLSFQKMMTMQTQRALQERGIKIQENRLLMDQQLMPWRIGEMKGNILLKGERSKMNQREIELQKMGLDKNTPWWFRKPYESIKGIDWKGWFQPGNWWRE